MAGGTTQDTTQTAAPHRGHGSLARDELRAAVDREAGRRSWLLDFAPDLERHFRRDIGPSWIVSDAVAAGVGLVIYNAWSFAEAANAPDIWWIAALFRLLVVTPVIVGMVVVNLSRPRAYRSSAVRAAVVVLGVLPILGIYAFSDLPGVGICYVLFPMLLAFLNLNVSLMFMHTIPAVGLVCGAFTVAAVLNARITHELMPVLLTLGYGVAALVLIAKYRLESALRRAWLLSTADRLRTHDLRELAATLSVESNTDPLTGVANRRKFGSRLATMCASPEGGSLILIDIDQFKAYNDLYGHQAGDACLQEIVRLIGERLRLRRDVLARYGGEEFAVLLPGCRHLNALAIAEHYRRTIEEAAIPHEALGPGRLVTISLGVATTQPGDAEHPDGLLARADLALYEAKSAGRNQVCPKWMPAYHAEGLDEVAWLEPDPSEGEHPRVA